MLRPVTFLVLALVAFPPMPHAESRGVSVPMVDSLRLAHDLLDRRQFLEAEALCMRSMAMLDSSGMGRTPMAAETLDLLVGSLFTRMMVTPEVRSLADRAVQIRSSMKGVDPDLARSLLLLGRIQDLLDENRASRESLRRALAICEATLGLSDSLAGEINMALGWNLLVRDSVAAAEPLCERAVSILERTVGPTSPKLAAALNAYGFVFLCLGDARDVPTFQRAIRIYEGAYGSDDPSLITPLMNLGRTIWIKGDTRAARPIMERALHIAEQRLEPDHPRLAIALLVNADFLLADEPSKAAEYFERAGRILEKRIGPTCSDLAWSLAGTGLARMQLGDFAGARLPIERSLRMREQIWGPEGGDVVYSLVELADLYRYLGDSEAAIPLMKRAVRIRERTFGKRSPEAIAPMCELANAHLEAGSTEVAKGLFLEGLRRVEQNQGKSSYLAIGPLMGLACIARMEKQDALAASRFERMLRILEETRDASDSDIGWVLANMAGLSLDQGAIAQALSRTERALDYYRRTFGNAHPSWAWILAIHAQALHAAGRDHESLRAALEAESVAREHLKLTIRTLSERQALRFASARTSTLDLALDIASSPKAPEHSVAEGWDALIRARALVLDEVAARRCRSGSDSLWNAYSASRQRLANLIVKGVEQDRWESYRNALSKAREQSEDLERLLAEADPSFRNERGRGDAGLAEVLSALPEQSALVSFARYTTERSGSRARGTDHYVAFVSCDGAEPEVVRIGVASHIDRLIGLWRQEVVRPSLEGGSRNATVGYRTVASELRRAVWDPIAPHVRTARTIFMVPDGLLNLVSFSALPWQQASYLAETDQTIHYISAERDLLHEGDTLRTGTGLLALGDPDYDADPRLGNSLPSGFTMPATAEPVAYRGQTTRCHELGRLKWHRLPATGPEVTEVAAAWSRGSAASEAGRDGESGRGSVLLRGGGATEYAFKRCAAGRRVLHLATHGFALGEDCGAVRAGMRGVGGFSARPGKDPVAQGPIGGSLLGENPFLLSGLVLAGANRRQDIADDHEDGILTAEEIAALDLSGVEWVVLSACESGVGAVRWREGVFGLRRAFRVAGAGTLITSLWPVEDAATHTWMRALYESRFGWKMTTDAAVHRATLVVLRDRRARGLSTHPFYWASFVAAGDWR